MCDLAKTADLVLLLVDASFGFEMETFEFLNVLKVGVYRACCGELPVVGADGGGRCRCTASPR
jgi:ribosome biogenesis protein BMS1